MHPFNSADFYIPDPARLNPHLETARTRSKSWAYQMGILGDTDPARGTVIWEEADFDAQDPALLCAYTHPEAPAAELDLITGWYVWVFFFDERFRKLYKRTRDLEGARASLARLPLFMPLTPAGARPEPRNAVERALWDLWTRTLPAASLDWRKRFIASTHNLLLASMWELTNLREGRVVGPVEYIEVRRRLGGAAWSAGLVEHAVGAEIPAAIAATRPMKKISDAFSDAVHLRYDLFSYQREVERESASCVLVLQRFLDLGTQQAVDLASAILSSRLQQLEDTALTEIAPLCAEHGLPPASCLDVARYVKGLADWLSGAHAWHLRSSRARNQEAERSPNKEPLAGSRDPGASAARLRLTPASHELSQSKSFSHVPYQPVGRLKLPRIYMPYPLRLSSHLATARRSTIEWARKLGLLSVVPGVFGTGLWDERQLAGADYPICAAGIHPDATAAELELSSCWLAWGTYADDYFPTVFGTARDVAGAQAFVTRLCSFMPLDCGITPSPANPVESGLADLWMRTAPSRSQGARQNLRRRVEVMLESWLWELVNHIQNRIPDPVDYIEMRRRTFGADLTMTLSKRTICDVVPAEVFQTRTLQALDDTTADYAAWANDLYSYRKEIEFEGEPNNLVLVVQQFLDCDPQRAMAVVSDLMTARLRQFEHVVATDLPVLFEELELGLEVRAALLQYVEKQRDYMGGVLNWHVMTSRYFDHELERRRFERRIEPPGSGSAASHVRSFFGGPAGSGGEAAAPFTRQGEGRAAPLKLGSQ